MVSRTPLPERLSLAVRADPPQPFDRPNRKRLSQSGDHQSCSTQMPMQNAKIPVRVTETSLSSTLSTSTPRTVCER